MLNSHAESKITVCKEQTWSYRIAIFNTQELSSFLPQCPPNKNAKGGVRDKKEIGKRKEAPAEQEGDLVWWAV